MCAAVIVTLVNADVSEPATSVDPSVTADAEIDGYTGICAVRPDVPDISYTVYNPPAIDFSCAVKIASFRTFVNNDVSVAVNTVATIFFLLIKVNKDLY
jgi:hypothetical protein